MRGRIAVFVALLGTSLFGDELAAQARPDPIARGCFKLSLDGEGPRVPATVEIHLFRDTAPQNAGETPNAWDQQVPAMHPLSLPPSPGVWIAMDRPYGLEVGLNLDDPADRVIVIFQPEGDRLRGHPSSATRDGPPRHQDFTIWADSTDCPTH